MGASERQFNYGIGVDDKGTLVFEKFKKTILDGNKDINSSTQGIIDRTRRYGDETNRLSDFIRKQRAESREQNFLFRESTQAIGAASATLALFGNTLGQSDGKMKKFTDSLNQGFVTFQGLSFLLSGAGPWGVAAAGIGGVASALFSMNKNLDETTPKIKEQKTEIDLLAGSYTHWRDILKGSVADNKAVSEVEIGLLKARADVFHQVIEAQKAGARDMTIIINDQKLSTGEVLEAQMAAATATKQTLKENEEEYAKVTSKIKGVTAAMNEVIVTPIEQKFESNLKPLELTQSALGRVEGAYKGVLGAITGVETTRLDFGPPINNMVNLNFQLQETQKELALATIGSEHFYRTLSKVEGLKKAINDGATEPLMKFTKTLGQVIPYAAKGFTLIQMSQLQNQNELIQGLEEEKEAAIKSIDERLAVTVKGSQQEMALMKEKAALQASFDARIRAEKRRAFVADKEARIIESVMQTAAAVTEALPNFILAGIVGALGIAQTAIIASQPIPKFHSGGVVPGSSMSEYPILARGGETIRTEAQERAIQETINNDNSARSVIVNVNMYAPTDSVEWVKRAVQEGLRAAGINEVDKYFRSSRHAVMIQ